MSSPQSPDFPSSSTFVYPYEFDDYGGTRCKSRSSSLRACFSGSRPTSIADSIDYRSITSGAECGSDEFYEPEFSSFDENNDRSTTPFPNPVPSTDGNVQNLIATPINRSTFNLAFQPIRRLLSFSEDRANHETEKQGPPQPPRRRMTIVDIRTTMSNMFRLKKTTPPVPGIEEHPQIIQRTISPSTRLSRRMMRSVSFSGVSAVSDTQIHRTGGEGGTIVRRPSVPFVHSIWSHHNQTFEDDIEQIASGCADTAVKE
jgi:hypothetical protein